MEWVPLRDIDPEYGVHNKFMFDYDQPILT